MRAAPFHVHCVDCKRNAEITPPVRTSRLKTSIWAAALIRRAQAGGAFAAVLHKGDPDSGSVMLSVRGGDGLHVLYQSATSMDGSRLWMASAPAPEHEVSGKITKRRSGDSDLWVIEIEDCAGRHFLTEAVEGAVN